MLIGSYARGDACETSDVDILRVGHERQPLLPSWVSGLAYRSYIDYTIEEFVRLCEIGSLFLFHVFSEGMLLEGDDVVWDRIRSNFNVASSFDREISEYASVLNYADSYPFYKENVVPYLSIVFRSIKNIGIFSLAQRKCYMFDKLSALRYGFGLPEQMSKDFIHLDNCYERIGRYGKSDLIKFEALAQKWKGLRRF
ncbi:hypothetical protein SR882_08435 [Guyparkeria halophila]|uniref:Polymerase nucleotidyl transferase domain-containing protein n=1 Tax=Guyparkeria halophila TaxID=47960 RepID=A0ABZ0YWL8_9GAMM|nr:hypothetical protein SR882_08435 [Guyparkeria halophila]